MSRSRNSRNKNPKRKALRSGCEPWVSLNHIKEKTGLSVKDIHFVLLQRNLWDRRRPSRNAIENHIARYNKHMSRYEWRNSIVTRLVNAYIKAGTAEARNQLKEKTMNKSWIDQYIKDYCPDGLLTFSLKDFLEDYCTNESQDMTLTFHPYSEETGIKVFGYCTIEYLGREEDIIRKYDVLYLGMVDHQPPKYLSGKYVAYPPEALEIFENLEKNKRKIEQVHNVQIKIDLSENCSLSLNFL